MSQTPPTTDEILLTILMPCLNEAETIGRCIERARDGLLRSGVAGEILVADNGSTDGSQAIAQELGARIVAVAEKGYGSALRGGVAAASGKWIIMGDADDSYDFSEAYRFVERFQAGDELVMGCRMPRGGGTITPGAMPWKNRWIGNPVLSFIGRLFFKCPVRDFHCGLRGFTKEAFDRMELRTTGMEFASEMAIKATLKKLRISEVPITLHRDGRSRPPHLKPWRDGWRHLRFMLLYSPRWLFLKPGLLLSTLGVVMAGMLAVQTIRIGGVALDAGSLMMACMAVVVGCQLTAFAFYTKMYAITEGFLPEDPKFTWISRFFTLEKGITISLVVLAAGFGLLARAVWLWKRWQFGPLPSMAANLRLLIPAATLILLGVQGVFSCFFLSVLTMKTTGAKP